MDQRLALIGALAYSVLYQATVAIAALWTGDQTALVLILLCTAICYLGCVLYVSGVYERNGVLSLLVWVATLGLGGWAGLSVVIW